MAEEGGNTANILQQFLLMQITCSDTTLPHSSKDLDLLKPPREEVTSTNQKMESYCDRKHGAKQSVLVKNYHGNRVSWRQGKITRRIGNVIYDVHVGSETWFRHANELKEAYSQPTQRSNMLPLNILIEHLDMNSGREADTQVEDHLPEATVHQQSRRTTPYSYYNLKEFRFANSLAHFCTPT
ncbi:hypothetical protein CSKR_114281 [Clonorchis sinensis]|uniref:Uncharacterized protein n=1 Tax=Clonorchis sinensis TaxID=79923 RepID=A0A419QHM9_CLOSI|nr:hypothetical protein CSKR_114281 [Clonorchis sinensis]